MSVVQSAIKKVKKFIFFSSGSVYGFWRKCKPNKFPIDEKQKLPTLKQGQTFYGHTKIEVEKYLKSLKKIDITVLRIEGIDKGHTRLEWINGFNDLNGLCRTPSKPAFTSLLG